MQEGYSEFLAFAYRKGKVREIREAFEEYLVLEEWHEGKRNSFVQEEEELYSIYHVGDIIFVKEYCYQDGSEGRNHLFVIIEQNNIAVPAENFGMLISSNLSKLKYDANKFIAKDEKNGLKTNSLVKTDILYKIRNEQILFKVGNVEEDKIEEYKQNFYKQNSKDENILADSETI